MPTEFYSEWYQAGNKFRADFIRSAFEGTATGIEGVGKTPFRRRFEGGDGHNKHKIICPQTGELSIVTDRWFLEKLHFAHDKEYQADVYWQNILSNQEFDDNTVWIDEGTDWAISGGDAVASVVTAGTDTSKFYQTAYQTTSIPHGIYTFDVSFNVSGGISEPVSFWIVGYNGSWVELAQEGATTNGSTNVISKRVIINDDYTRIGFYVQDIATTIDYNVTVNYFRLKQYLLRGYVDTTNISELHNVKNKGTIEIYDGLGELQEFEYDNAGTPYDEWQTVGAVVGNVLGKIGLGLFINENIDIWGKGLNQGSSNSMLTQEYVHTRSYWNDQNDISKGVKTAERVLADICEATGARIVQAWGEWWLQKVDVKSPFDFRTLTSSGTPSSSTTGFDTEIAINTDLNPDRTSKYGLARSKKEVKITTNRGLEHSVLEGTNFAEEDFASASSLNDWDTTNDTNTDPHGLWTPGASAHHKTARPPGSENFVLEFDAYVPDHEQASNDGDAISDDGGGGVRITSNSHGLTTSDWVIFWSPDYYTPGMYKVTAAAANTFDLNMTYSSQAQNVAFWTDVMNGQAIEIKDALPFGEGVTLEDSNEQVLVIEAEYEYNSFASSTVLTRGLMAWITVIARVNSTDYKTFGLDHNGVSFGQWYDYQADNFIPIIIRIDNRGKATIKYKVSLGGMYTTTTHDMYVAISTVNDGSSSGGIYWHSVKLYLEGSIDETTTKTINSNYNKMEEITLLHADPPQDANDEYLYLNPFRKLSGGDHLMVDNHIQHPFEGIVADYKLDETTGTTATDHVNGHDGTASGTVTVGVAGKINTAYQFATDGLINIDDLLTNELASTTIGAWETWYKPDDATPAANETLISFGDTNANEFIRCGIQSDGKFRLGCVLAGVTQYVLETDNAVFSDGIFTHLMVVHNGIQATLYVDEEEVAQTFTGVVNKAIWFNDLTGLDNGRIGCRNANSAGDTQFSNGVIDEVRFYTLNKTASEVSDLYNFNLGLEGFYTIQEILADNYKRLYERNSYTLEMTALQPGEDFINIMPVNILKDILNFDRKYMISQFDWMVKDEKGKPKGEIKSIEILPAGPIGPEDPEFNDASKWIQYDANDFTISGGKASLVVSGSYFSDTRLAWKAKQKIDFNPNEKVTYTIRINATLNSGSAAVGLRYWNGSQWQTMKSEEDGVGNPLSITLSGGPTTYERNTKSLGVVTAETFAIDIAGSNPNVDIFWIDFVVKSYNG